MNTESRELYEKLISGQTDDIVPRSRIEERLLTMFKSGVGLGEGASGVAEANSVAEEHLKTLIENGMASGNSGVTEPRSRIEAYLMAMIDKGITGVGGGGGGVGSANIVPLEVMANGTYTASTGEPAVGRPLCCKSDIANDEIIAFADAHPDLLNAPTAHWNGGTSGIMFQCMETPDGNRVVLPLIQTSPTTGFMYATQEALEIMGAMGNIPVGWVDATNGAPATAPTVTIPADAILACALTDIAFMFDTTPIDGYAPVTVNVMPSIEPLTITENGTYEAPEGTDGYAPIEVNVEIPEPTIEPLTITENGTYEAPEGTDGYSPVIVNAPDKMQLIIDVWNTRDTFLAGFLGSSAANMVTDDILAQLLGGVNLDNVTNMDHMFAYYMKLTTAPQLDTSKVTNMRSMFSECCQLTTVPQFDTSNVTDMGKMFNFCKELTTVPQFDTSNVKNMNGMFMGCSQLTTVPRFDVRNAFNLDDMLYGCDALTECWLRNIKTNFVVGSDNGCCDLITVDSLTHLIYELRDTGSSKKLTIGSTNRAKLADVYVKTVEVTDEMRAEDDLVDEKLPFVVCESTDEGATPITSYVSLKNWTLA